MFVLRLIGSVLYIVVFFGLLLFLPAWTLNWWRAWVFLGVTVIATVITMLLLYPTRQDLITERWKPPIQRGQPLADKIIISLFFLTYLGYVVLVPLDVFRFHLLPRPGIIVSTLGMILYIVGWVIITLALKENAFASVVVRHQEERRQAVIDTGIYGVVRHPIYAGATPYIIGMPLWLESYTAAIAGLIVVGLIIVRILFEERFLSRELAGYPEYMQRVRYKLIPGVW